MTRIATFRQPAVAGSFYPDDPDKLRQSIHSYLHDAKPRVVGLRPKALIVPHAGYQYSGPVAASGYAQLKDLRETIRRVVLLGPSHHVAFGGLAVPSVDAFATPLGNIPIDPTAVAGILNLQQVFVGDEPHRTEHSLEVQLPFLQCVLDTFTIIPLCVGTAASSDVAEVLIELWGDSETLIVVSSDLSHYHDQQTAEALDYKTSTMIEECQFENLRSENACGYVSVQGLLQVVRKRGLKVTNVDLRNSAETAGPRGQVVGYGAYVIN